MRAAKINGHHQSAEEGERDHPTLGTRGKKRRGLISVAAAIIGVGCASLLATSSSLAHGAVDIDTNSPDRALTIAQYIHTAWKAQDGAPADAWALAQTADGWLWLGTSTGLYRFDGIRFERVPIEGLDPGRSKAIHGLVALESGELWIAYVYGGASVLKNGRFTHYAEPEGMDKGTILDFVQDAQGAMWAASSLGLHRFDGKRWQRIGSESGFADRSATNLLLDQHGTLWVAGEKELLLLPRGSRRFERAGLPAAEFSEFCQSPDGRAWYLDRTGVHPLPGQDATKPRTSWSNASTSYILLIDRDGSLWSIHEAVLSHWPPPREPFRQFLLEGHTSDDTFSAKNGLTGSLPKAMMEDREGNIWVSTNAGLDRFRPPKVRKLPLPVDEMGFYALAAGAHGSVWIGTHITGDESMPTDGLWKFDTRLVRVAPQITLGVTAADLDTNGVLWIGGREGIWRQEGGERFIKVAELPDDLHGQMVHALTIDSAGDPWVSAVRASHLLRFQNGEWKPNGDVPELPDTRPQVQARDGTGRLWFGYRDGRIAVVGPKRATVFGAKEGLQIGTIFAIHPGRHTLVASEAQIAVLGGGRFHALTAPADPTVLEGVTGIVETSNGDVWLNGFRGAVRIAAADLEKALRSGSYKVPFELFDAGDGYPGLAQRVRPLPTAIEGTDGRLWFAGSEGVAWIDPAHIHRSEIPPPLVIRSLTAGGQMFATTGVVQLAKGIRSLQIDYTALNLTRPERTRFRYRLEGFDETWLDAGARRQAFYTNLHPGRYRFRVVATNENGVWNESGATLAISIPPTFVQTKTFLVLCTLAGLIFLWFVCALRVRQVTARERSRLKTRLLERERIARELHDTLFQGLLSASLQLQVADSEIPRDASGKHRVERVVQLLRQTIDEGRSAVRDLRAACSKRDDLERAFAQIPQDLAVDEKIEYRLILEGIPRALRPSIRYEVYRIGGEALANAFQHSRCKLVETVLQYARNRFRLVIRDDGCGMDPAIVRSGREGHWGLAGMRERSERIGARLTVRSAIGAGTEIDLIVSSRAAFEPTGSHSPLDWLAKLYAGLGD